MTTEETEFNTTDSLLLNSGGFDAARAVNSVSIISELARMPGDKVNEIEALLQVYDGDNLDAEAFSVRAMGLSAQNARRLQLLAERASIRGIAISPEDLLESIVSDWFRRIAW